MTKDLVLKHSLSFWKGKNLRLRKNLLYPPKLRMNLGNLHQNLGDTEMLKKL